MEPNPSQRPHRATIFIKIGSCIASAVEKLQKQQRMVYKECIHARP
ncbi:Predicted flavoprotein CzcO associated with the cation diffusion facilitator CzcD [Pseudomonas syringae pv. actinidiae]|uniref:Predicted flavoprotein CzcO associated with the cation diffusion facilitator CzcD n=1 Tax=Pseudomonas syringae pv. actinidiae TaxID=103796 RepID=A0AAN4TJ77_PSESF|nr:Predicted flavoprotein CzcO associated with the cation diffusion facilitator CzcD [Pseudomonas syringae pv. actinidiae]